MPVAGKPRSPISFQAKPKFCEMRPVHLKYGHQGITTTNKNKKSRIRKTTGFGKYDMFKKSTVPDYTDCAYREAVSRLRFLLNESYVPPSRYPPIGAKPEESDDESGVSIVVSDRTRVAKLSPFRRPHFPLKNYSAPKVSNQNPYGENQAENMNAPAPPELMAFIERQEEYIEQLERESQYCRDELSQLLNKVKDLIAENETLHEQQKSGVLKQVFDGVEEDTAVELQHKDKYRKRLEGPMIVFESRISELEAQLTQSRIDLRKAQEEAEMYKKKALEADPTSSSSEFYKQIENLQREKRDLNESLAKLQSSLSQIREKELDASKKVQRTLDVVDKTTFEKQQAEMEVNRLKNELEHQHDKLLEVLSGQTKKVADERGQAERRYYQHVEQLSAELAIQRDTATKLQLDLEKHLRIEEDLRRDLAAKNMTIESVKKELNNKIASLQNELTAALTERDSLEQELSTSRMSGERSERLIRQESSRLQVEITALRQRLDRADAELMHARRENLRLAEQIASQEKEITLFKIKVGENDDALNGYKGDGNSNELNSRISDMETKHVETVAELEGLIESQSQAMAQLKAECQSLTQKLEESTARHKEEMANLQSNLDKLTSILDSTLNNRQWEPTEETSQPNLNYLENEKQYEASPSVYGKEISQPNYPGNDHHRMEDYTQGNKNYEQQPYDNNPDYQPESIPESYHNPAQPTPQSYPDNQEYDNQTGYHQQSYENVPQEGNYQDNENYGYRQPVEEYQPEPEGNQYQDPYTEYQESSEYQQEQDYGAFPQTYETEPEADFVPEMKVQDYPQQSKAYQPAAELSRQSSKNEDVLRSKMASPINKSQQQKNPISKNQKAPQSKPK